MPIVIRKKAKAEEAPAPVVQEAIDKPPFEPRSAEEARKDWQKTMPAPGAKPKECPYCHHWYVMPCDEKRHLACGNFLHLQTKEPKK